MFGLAAPTDDIGIVLDAVASKMGFNIKKPHARGSRVSKDRELFEDGGSRRNQGEEAHARDTLRSAQHLIQQYRCGALGKFVLDEPSS